MVHSVAKKSILKSPVISSKPFHLGEMLWTNESNFFNHSNFDFVSIEQGAYLQWEIKWYDRNKGIFTKLYC